MGRSEGEKSFGTSRRRENNIKLNLEGVSCDATNCMKLAQYKCQWKAYVRVVMNPEKYINQEIGPNGYRTR